MSEGMTKREYMQMKKKRYIYRRVMLGFNIFFVCFIAVFLITGFFFTVTGKRLAHDKGVKYYNNGQYEDAVASFQKSIEKTQWFSDKLDIDSILYCADCYLQLGEFESAQKMYQLMEYNYPAKKYDERALQNNLQMTEALIAYSNGDYSVVGQLNKAIDNGHPEINLYAAICYEKAGNYEAMYNCYRAYEKAFGKTAYLCNRYAAYYIAKRDYKWALEYINDGLEFQDETFHDELLRARIECLSRIGDYENAYLYSAEYVAAHPEDEEAKENMIFLATRITVDTTTVYDLYFGVPGSNNENKGNVSEP